MCNQKTFSGRDSRPTTAARCRLISITHSLTGPPAPPSPHGTNQTRITNLISPRSATLRPQKNASRYSIIYKQSQNHFLSFVFIGYRNSVIQGPMIPFAKVYCAKDNVTKSAVSNL